MSHTEPRMKAIPPSTKWFSTIRTAAMMLPTSPVIEMALGVSLDSTRRERASVLISAPVSGPSRPARGEPPRRGRAVPSPRGRSRSSSVTRAPWRRPCASPRPPAGTREGGAGGVSRGGGHERAQGGVEPEVVGGDHHDQGHDRGIDRPERLEQAVTHQDEGGNGDHERERHVHARHRGERVVEDVRAVLGRLADEARDRVGEPHSGRKRGGASDTRGSRRVRGPSRP